MGQMFEGLSLLGYDKIKKKFVSLWIDSTSTSFYHATGTLDATKKIRTETGLWPDPMTGGNMKVEMVTTSMGKDSFKFEMYMYMGKDKFKSMEMIYTRKK